MEGRVRRPLMLTLFLTYIDDDDDKILFERIFNQNRKQMVTLANSILHNEQDAEDVVHDVFLRIAIKYMNVIRKINCEQDMRNYLLKATKHTSINLLRKRKSDNISLDEVVDFEATRLQKLSDTTFIDTICKHSEYEQVILGMKMLNEKYRDVLYYHFVLELSVNETASVLKQTVSATKKQLVRGKKMLIDSLNLEGIDSYGH